MAAAARQATASAAALDTPVTAALCAWVSHVVAGVEDASALHYFGGGGWGCMCAFKGPHLEYKSRTMAIKSLKASAQVHCDAWMRNSTRLWPH